MNAVREKQRNSIVFQIARRGYETLGRLPDGRRAVLVVFEDEDLNDRLTHVEEDSYIIVFVPSGRVVELYGIQAYKEQFSGPLPAGMLNVDKECAVQGLVCKPQRVLDLKALRLQNPTLS